MWLNHALHIAAIVQVRYDTPGRAYYFRKIAEGKSKKEALHCVKRRLSDAVWRQLQVDRTDDQHQDDAWPRWASKRGGMPRYRSPDTPRADGRPMQPRPVSVSPRRRVRGVASPKHQHRVKADHAAGLTAQQTSLSAHPEPSGLTERSQSHGEHPSDIDDPASQDA